MKRYILAAALSAAFACSAQAQTKDRLKGDTDGDGKISQSEFRALQAGSGLQMFNNLDTNKDGRVTRAEFDAVAAKFGAAKTKSGASRADKFFGRMDGDKDGVVTRAEMDAAADVHFKKGDTDKDGSLSKAEVAAMKKAAGVK